VNKAVKWSEDGSELRESSRKHGVKMGGLSAITCLNAENDSISDCLPIVSANVIRV